MTGLKNKGEGNRSGNTYDIEHFWSPLTFTACVNHY
jgi:hypothetical protein